MNLLKPRKEKLYRLIVLLAVLAIPLITVSYASLQTTFNIITNVSAEEIISVNYDCSSGSGSSFIDYAVAGDGYIPSSNTCGHRIIDNQETNLYHQEGWALSEGGIAVSPINLTEGITLYPVWESSI